MIYMNLKEQLMADFKQALKDRDETAKNTISLARAAVKQSMGIEGGKENMGKLMGAVIGKTKGLADGNEVRKQVMAFLG